MRGNGRIGWNGWTLERLPSQEENFCLEFYGTLAIRYAIIVIHIPHARTIVMTPFLLCLLACFFSLRRSAVRQPLKDLCSTDPWLALRDTAAAYALFISRGLPTGLPCLLVR